MNGNFENAANVRPIPPFVSIVINNYNYAQFLADAIDSALAQTYPHVEVIVVDDGSTDDSKSVVESYGEKIKAIYQANGGQAAALNRGYEATCGELIYFLDSDDIALPNALEKIVALYEQTATNNGAATLQFKLETVNCIGKPIGGVTPDLEKLEGSNAARLLESKGSYVHPPTSGNIFSRKILEQIMPIPEKEYRICADLYLCTLAPFAGIVIDIDEALAQYRIHGANHCATLLNTKDSLPIEDYIEMRFDESSARRRQKKICAAYLRRPIGGNTDLLFLIFEATKEKLLKTSAGGFKMARRLWSDLRRDTSLVPARNKLAALAYLMSVALLPRPIIRQLVKSIFVRPPKPFETILKKSFGR